MKPSLVSRCAFCVPHLSVEAVAKPVRARGRGALAASDAERSSILDATRASRPRGFATASVFSLLAAFLLTGCSSLCIIDRNVPEGAVVEGEKPLATFYVKNISYQILGFIPWTTGTNWTEDSEPYEDANGVNFTFFDDTVSLDNNIRTLKRACREVGSNRVASLTNTVNEDNFWSFFIINRKTLKTTCFILPKK